jgi:hypothetical protein
MLWASDCVLTRENGDLRTENPDLPTENGDMAGFN